MKNDIKQIIICILVVNFFSLATAADPVIPSSTQANSDPSVSITNATDPAFNASDFQKNAGTTIQDLSSKIDNFLKQKEISDLNYGLHIVNRISDDQEIELQSSEQQFIKDFARMSCYSNYESNLPECNKDNDKNSQKTYGMLRPSNIFNIPLEKQDDVAEALAAFAVKTMIDPLPDPKLNKILENGDLNDSTKQKNLATLIAAQGPITLAKNSLNEIIAKRKNFSESTDQKSIIKMIKDESTRRLSKDWIENIGNLPLRHLILELLQIEAFKVWMDYNKFLQNERIEALIATLLASQTASLNKMITQLQEMTDEAKKSADDASKKLDQENKYKGNNNNDDEGDTKSKIGFQ